MTYETLARKLDQCLAAQVELIKERDALKAALEELSSMYTHAWDRVDGCLVMMDSSIEKFEAAHESARAALAQSAK